MSRDRIFAARQADVGSFEFSDEVAEVFPDMLNRSIPGYAATLQAIGTLASRYVRPNTNCYDLGCSLGAATMAMRRNIAVPGCRIIAVDNAPAMITRCRELIPVADGDVEVSIVEQDLRQTIIEQASMVVMNYTLQFLSVGERQSLIGRIYKGLVHGGVLVLSEKVVDDDAVIEDLLVQMHHQFKRAHAYSDLEISRKRTALENVLIPEPVATHQERLYGAGFRHIGVWLRQFNFVSMVAVK